MKKLMVVAAVALAAVCSQAAQFKWTAFAVKDGYNSGTTPYTPGNAVGTGYLIFAADYSQQSIIDGIKNGTITAANIAGYSVAGAPKAIASGNISQTTAFDYDSALSVGEKETAYFVVFSPDEKYAYVSATALAEVKESGAGTFAFGQQTKSNTIGTTVGTWQSIPEPTSGLLLLLGVAGLALRRRRA